MQPITLWRRLSQFAFFFVTGEWLAVGWLRCPFGVPFVSCQSCVLADCPGKYLQLPFLGIIGLSSLLFGRAFCGWACPMGLVEDALGRLPKPSRRFRQWFAKADRVLKWAKWPILVIVVWAVFAHNYQADHRPYEYVTRTPSVFNVQAVQIAWGLGGGPYRARFVVLAVALVGGLVVTRLWCRYLCPLGALISVFNKLSVFALHRDKRTCTDCGLYPDQCSEYTVPGTTDCVMCGECVQGCPTHSIKFGTRRRAKPAESPQEAPQEAIDP